MMDEVLSRIGQVELRALYAEADPGAAGRWGADPADLEDWERWRKYAYSKYWENRLNEQQPLAPEEIQEWRAYVQLDFLNNVASSVVGDAARRDLLQGGVIATLQATPQLTKYASRQLSARLALSRSGIDSALVDELLDLKASWALHELLARDLGNDELALLEAAAQDHRLSRIERHDLREALRLRPR